MTNRERVFAALSHQQTDIIPYNIAFTHESRRKLVEHYGDENFEDKLGNCFQFLDFDGFDRCKEVKPNIFQDWFGVQWDRTMDKDIGSVCNRLITERNFHTFQFPDPNGHELYEGKMAILKRAQDKIIVGNLGFSLFERAWTLMGMEELLIAMALNKNMVHAFLDRIVEYDLQVLMQACTYPIDGVRFGDDWGQQSGLIMGPVLWREFIKPRIKRMYEFVKSKGKFVLIHCCGKIQEVLPDLIEVGVDVFNPFQPEVMDVFEIKKQFGSHISFYGGISTQRTLPYATADRVQEEVRRLLDVMGNGGGYIASPAHNIPADARPDNVAAMIEVLKRQ